MPPSFSPLQERSLLSLSLPTKHRPRFAPPLACFQNDSRVKPFPGLSYCYGKSSLLDPSGTHIPWFLDLGVDSCDISVRVFCLGVDDHGISPLLTKVSEPSLVLQ